jgi:hypothetical protein
MTHRVPPRMATWFLRRLGPAYQRESLAGDLHEEYQLNRSRAWYWWQVFVAVSVGRMAGTRKLLERLSAVARRARVKRLATSTVLRLSTEAAALLGAIALTDQIHVTCPLDRTTDAGWMATLLGGVGLCLSVGLYLSLCRPAATPGPAAQKQRARPVRKGAPIRRLIGVFAVTALSAGTLTWASGTSYTPQQCSHSSSAAVSAASDAVRDDVNRK